MASVSNTLAMLGLRRRLLCLLAAGVCLGGQRIILQNGTTAQKALPRHTVTGTVVNAITGEPIRNALVQAWGTSTVTALTSADGRFELHDIPEGVANIQANKPGYFNSQNVPAVPRDYSYTVGPGTNEFRIALLPAASIVGRLTDQDGEPLEQTTVTALHESISNGHKEWSFRGSAGTDDDGTFRIDDLLPGEYVIFTGGQASPDMYWGVQAQVIAPAYYPETPDLASAQRIALQAGQQFHADFHLHWQRGYRVAGSFSGSPANAGVGFWIRNADGQNVSWSGTQFNPKKGTFAAYAVAPGTWFLTVAANGGGHTYEGRREITVGAADITDLHLVLSPGVSIPVSVNHSGSGPRDPNTQSFLNAALTSVDSGNLQSYGLSSTTPSANEPPPVMSFQEIRPGKYKLNIQNAGNECVESAWYGGVDLLRSALIVSPDDSGQTMVINLTSDCATLTATIANPQEHNSGVLLVVPDSGFDEPKMVPLFASSAFPDGRRFPPMSLALSPGSYHAYAFSKVDDLEYANPEVLRDYPSQTVDLTPGQKAEVSVTVVEPKVTK